MVDFSQPDPRVNDEPSEEELREEARSVSDSWRDENGAELYESRFRIETDGERDHLETRFNITDNPEFTTHARDGGFLIIYQTHDPTNAVQVPTLIGESLHEYRLENN